MQTKHNYSSPQLSTLDVEPSQVICSTTEVGGGNVDNSIQSVPSKQWVSCEPPTDEDDD